MVSKIRVKNVRAASDFLSGNDIDCYVGNKLIFSMYLLPDGSGCIHLANNIIICKEIADVGTYKGTSEFHEIQFRGVK